MSYYDNNSINPYAASNFAIDAPLDERLAFLRKTYAHLLGAILLFCITVGILLNVPAITGPLAGMALKNWWLVLLAFMGVSWVAQSMAYNQSSEAMQYAGLILYTVVEALIFTPLLFVMANFSPNGTETILQAGVITLVTFGGLTAVVLVTRQDFSFLRNILWVAGLAALGLAFASAFGVVSLGTWFAVAMIILMCGYILYDTSNVLHHFPTTAHVAVSLALFSSLATLFWYVLRLMSILKSDD
jgi:FtsH-binding integral membrane protein